MDFARIASSITIVFITFGRMQLECGRISTLITLGSLTSAPGSEWTIFHTTLLKTSSQLRNCPPCQKGLHLHRAPQPHSARWSWNKSANSGSGPSVPCKSTAGGDTREGEGFKKRPACGTICEPKPNAQSASPPAARRCPPPPDGTCLCEAVPHTFFASPVTPLLTPLHPPCPPSCTHFRNG